MCELSGFCVYWLCFSLPMSAASHYYYYGCFDDQSLEFIPEPFPVTRFSLLAIQMSFRYGYTNIIYAVLYCKVVLELDCRSLFSRLRHAFKSLCSVSGESPGSDRERRTKQNSQKIRLLLYVNFLYLKMCKFTEHG